MTTAGAHGKTICEVVRELSMEIGRWLKHQPKAGEESLTDWLLYQTQLQASVVSTMQFNKRQEGAVTGADWQWQAWFLTDAGSVGLRIQAKKLAVRPKDNSDGLRYPKGTGRQMTMLIEDARRHRMRAMYAFYTADSHSAACFSKKTNGICLASAKDLKRNFISPSTAATTPNAIVALTKPLECFFCCGMRVKKNAATLLVNEMFPDEPIVHAAPPPYVEDFLKTVRRTDSRQPYTSDVEGLHDDNNSVTKKFRQKHRLKLVRTYALTVFDLREQNKAWRHHNQTIIKRQ